MSTKYERHRQIAREQERTKLQNCALLCAYVWGDAPGWYGVVSGHIDGFRSDYAMVHSNPGDFEHHPVRAFYIVGNETELEYMADLDKIRSVVAKCHYMDDLPLVATLTEGEKEAARLAVRSAWEDYSHGLPDADLEQWLEELCDTGVSDLIGTDGAKVAEAVRGKQNVS